MSEYNYKEKIDQMYDTCQKQYKLKEGIVNELSNNGIQVKNKGNVYENLKTAFNSEVNTAENEVRNLISYYENLNKLFCAFYVENANYNNILIDRVVAERKAERKDHWKLWRDKLSRWTIGVSAAVLMYSALVALSKWTGWLVIPVRDLVVGG